jgi:hypothetical protein
MTESEKDRRQSQEDGSKMEALEKKHDASLSDSSSTAASVHAVKSEKHAGSGDASQSRSSHDSGPGPPDIDRAEAEAAVPGHDLDVELARVSKPSSLASHRVEITTNTPQNDDITALARIASRASTKSRISRILSRARTRERDRLPRAPIPLSNLDEGRVGWDSQDDPTMPLNFPQRKKWLIVGLLSAITLLTPFASSILAPGISSLNAEFGNTNSVIGTMTVSVYLLGYVIGPLFLAPLSELYGRKPVLGAANVFFCLWQIGCALAPSIEALIVFRFFAGIGGAGCLVS